jgi:hypothetical protein
MAVTSGVVAELVIPQNTTDTTKDALRVSHILAPVQAMMEEPVLWSHELCAFECSSLHVSPLLQT